MTLTSVDVDTVVAAIGGAIEAAMAPLVERIARLEAQPRALQYRGVFELGKTYERGDCVTDRGSLWVCRQQTGLRPAESSDAATAWQLAAKRGRDGRDAR